MSERGLKPESERIEDTFLVTLGSEILQRERDGKAYIGDLDGDLLRKFYRAGWDWGKESLLADQRRDEQAHD